MSWSVQYSDSARHDLRGIYEYIAYTLLVPETASRLTAQIMKEIRSLEEMPFGQSSDRQENREADRRVH